MEKYKDRGWLYDQYVTQDKTLVQIAEDLGVVYSTISAWRRRLGIRKPEKPSLNNTYITIKCNECDKGFVAHLRYLVRKIRLRKFKFFCGKECLRQRQSKEKMGLQNPMSGKCGEENPSWKGGVSGVNEYLRDSLSEWKREALVKSNFTCFITERRSSNLVVHHATPFHKIRDRVFSDLSFETKKHIRDYSREELNALSEKVSELHRNEKGYVLDARVHRLFHSLYGFEANELDLFEFRRRYHNGELSRGEIAV